MQIKIFPFRLSSFPQNRHFITRPLSAVGTATLRHFIGLSLAVLYIRFTRRFPIIIRSAEGFSNNMAKSVQLFWAITAIFAGLFLESGLSQRQICSYYGMNLLSSCYVCYLAEVILLHSLKTRCVLNRFELKTYTAKLNIRLVRFSNFCCRC